MLLNIPIKIINQSCQAGELSLLRDYIFIKTLYSNSCLYNRSYANLSRKTGFSRTKITKLIRLFKEKGWAREHANNIVLAWNKKPYKAFAAIKFITPNDILNQLRLFILTTKHKQCMYSNNLRKDRNLFANSKLKDVKASEKLKRKKFSGAICGEFVLSAGGAGRLFRKSASTGNQILLSLEQEGLIFIRRGKNFVSRCSKEGFKYWNKPIKGTGSYWWFKGGVYNSVPNVITIPSVVANKVLTEKKQGIKKALKFLKFVSNLRRLTAM